MWRHYQGCHCIAEGSNSKTSSCLTWANPHWSEHPKWDWDQAWNKRGVVSEETSVVWVAACAVACAKTRSNRVYFFSWMLHGLTSLLSGRSPFCQLQKGCKRRKLLDIKNQLKATTNQNVTNQSQCRLPESTRGLDCEWTVPRSINQGLVGESREHACWLSEGKGAACE